MLARAYSPRRIPPRRAPLTTVGPTEHQQPFPRLAVGFPSVSCPKCTKSFVAAAVVREEPSWSPDYQCYVRLVTLFCDHCDHLVHTLVTTNESGSRNGSPIVRDGIVRSRPEIEKFLEAHPEARGVLQA